jgi:hypothetical protein
MIRCLIMSLYRKTIYYHTLYSARPNVVRLQQGVRAMRAEPVREPETDCARDCIVQMTALEWHQPTYGVSHLHAERKSRTFVTGCSGLTKNSAGCSLLPSRREIFTCQSIEHHFRHVAPLSARLLVILRSMHRQYIVSRLPAPRLFLNTAPTSWCRVFRANQGMEWMQSRLPQL